MSSAATCSRACWWRSRPRCGSRWSPSRWPPVIGVLVGVLAGYRGGWIDTVVMRVVDVMFAFPVLLLALAIVAVLGPGITTTMLAIGIVYIPIFARVARASALGVRVEPFVAVSRSMGTGDGYILIRHILPNIAGPLIVQLSLSLGLRDPGRSRAVVSGAGYPTAAAVAGPDDLRRPGIRHAGLVDGGVPGRGDLRDGVGVQPVRRRDARCARSRSSAPRSRREGRAADDIGTRAGAEVSTICGWRSVAARSSAVCRSTWPVSRRSGSSASPVPASR